MHPQYRFISLHSPAAAGTFHCIPAILCLQPSVFSAVAPSHSHRAWLRLPHLRYLRSLHFQLSIIHYQLSVGSVALPLIKVHRHKGGCLLFFTRRFTLIAATFRSVPPLNSRVYGGCSIAATPPRRSSSAKKNSLPSKGAPLFLLLAVLGGVNCRFFKNSPEKHQPVR